MADNISSLDLSFVIYPSPLASIPLFMYPAPSKPVINNILIFSNFSLISEHASIPDELGFSDNK